MDSDAALVHRSRNTDLVSILDGFVDDLVVRNNSVRRSGNLCSVQKAKTCPKAWTGLTAELGFHQTKLYKWRDQMEPSSYSRKQRMR